MVVADIEISCRDCGRTFLFTAGEQEFFQQKGYTHQPTRCTACRAIARVVQPPRPPKPEKRLFTVNCAQCGNEAQVPFKPTQGRPVLCNACFRR